MTIQELNKRIDCELIRSSSGEKTIAGGGHCNRCHDSFGFNKVDGFTDRPPGCDSGSAERHAETHTATSS